MEPQKGAPLRRAPVLLTNVQLGWNWIAVANTLAYGTSSLITTVKCFLVQIPVVNLIIFWHKFTHVFVS